MLLTFGKNRRFETFAKTFLPLVSALEGGGTMFCETPYIYLDLVSGENPSRFEDQKVSGGPFYGKNAPNRVNMEDLLRETL